MFKRIVQRSLDGKYAIKRWNWRIWGWQYQGMNFNDIWWTRRDYIDRYCWTDDYNLVLKLFNGTKETVIKSK